MLGLTFKENCPDLRNTKVVDLIWGLERYGMEVAQREHGLSALPAIPTREGWSAVVAVVTHQQFAVLTAEQWRQLLTPSGVLLDLKGIVPRELGPLRL